MAGGVYKPSTDGLTDPRDATFLLPSDVAVVGGYAGYGAANPDERELARTPSILSGDLNGNDGPDFTNYLDNCTNVVSAFGLSPGTVLDGFTIVAGGSRGSSYGGGLRCVGGGLQVVRCTFQRNAGGTYGGAIAADAAALLLSNCVMSGNRATIGSAVLSEGASQVRIESSTIVGNGRNSCGQITAVAIREDSNVQVLNSILWSNFGCLPDEASEIQTDPDSTLTISFSCVEGYSGVYEGMKNIAEDPLLSSARGEDGVFGTPDDDLRLSQNSLLINGGEFALQDGHGLRDLDGHARLLCGRIDIGAYEFGAGDYDCNRRVDLRDVAGLQRCFTGVVTGFHEGCEALDLNGDEVIGLSDVPRFHTHHAGPVSPK